MRKETEKKHRFYYSEQQNNRHNQVWNTPTQFTFVKTPKGWEQYSEWCSMSGSKCNWEDAKLVYATDDDPEIIIHNGIPDFINELQEENNKLKQQLEEKDNEIESLKDNWNVLCDYLGDCIIKYDEVDVNGIYGEVLDKVNILKRYDYKRHQDKISFCIEKLEKVIKFIKECPQEPRYWDIASYINGQIEELEKGDGKGE